MKKIYSNIAILCLAVILVACGVPKLETDDVILEGALKIPAQDIEMSFVEEVDSDGDVDCTLKSKIIIETLKNVNYGADVYMCLLDKNGVELVRLSNYDSPEEEQGKRRYCDFKKDLYHKSEKQAKEIVKQTKSVKFIGEDIELVETKEEEVVIETQNYQPTNIQSQTESSASVDWDNLLDDYEDFIDDYIACMKKANNGDLSAISEMTELMQEVQNLSDKLANASSDLTASQYARYSKLMQKLANAASNL